MTIIEQADEIVGIKVALGAGGVLDYAYLTVKNTYRRGAYLEWLATQDESRCIDELNKRGSRDHRMGDMPVEKIADAIIAVHAATRPKGDGLPDKLDAVVKSFDPHQNYVAVRSCFHYEQDAERLRDYVNRCLSAPVRRLMAEFEVTEEMPKGVLAWGVFDDGFIKDNTFINIERRANFWLVPKAVKS